MNATTHARTLISAVAALAVLACRAPSERTGDSTTVAHADSSGSAHEGAPAQPVNPPATPAGPAAAAGAVDDEFVKLLASLGVTYRPAARTVEVGGWVNMQTGLIEVFACAPQGKTHETVVVLDCVPSGLHAGLLALGLEPGTPVEFGTGDEYRPPTGDPVEIELFWRDDAGVERSARAEDWVWDDKLKSAMPRAPWIFAGSFLQPVSGGSDAATYAADYIKSLATTYHDASSILENPHVEGIDDTVYFANEKAVPAVGTPVRAVFRRPR